MNLDNFYFSPFCNFARSRLFVLKTVERAASMVSPTLRRRVAARTPRKLRRWLELSCFQSELSRFNYNNSIIQQLLFFLPHTARQYAFETMQGKICLDPPTLRRRKIFPALSEAAAGGKTRELPRKRSSRLRPSRVSNVYCRAKPFPPSPHILRSRY